VPPLLPPGAQRATKGAKSADKYKLAIIGAGAATVFAVWLAMVDVGPSSKKTAGRASPDASLVNDNSFIKGVTSDASGNFTAAASPFFNKWTYGDFKYGLDGIALHGAGMIGMPGAIKTCPSDDDTEGGAVPPAYDVREAFEGCVGPVYDAGNCSSSYAVAAATTLGSRFCVADGVTYKGLRLSPQQVISCDKKSKGCNGGGVDSVWSYIQRRGLYPEDCVPFAGAKKAECKTTCDDSKKLKAIDHCVLTAGERAIKREIYNRGPVAAALDVKDDFLVYEGGIYTPTKYSRDQFGADGKPILQAVTIVGWGRQDGAKFWIVQGNWGTQWGEKGYARVAVDTVIRERYVIVGTAATAEAVAEKEKQEAEEEARKEQAKIDRAERDARIAEQRRIREEEQRAAQEAADLEDLDAEDLDDDVDLDEVE
jgi:KaiC/GvpD/RAD55 family RecA-like ATPase